MSEVFLHRLNVVAALDRGNGESMTQIVEACGRCADVSDDTLEAVVHSSIRQIAAGLVGKYEAVLFLCITGLRPHTVLLQLLKSEQLNHRGGQRQTAALVILWRREVILSTLFLLPAKLSFYRESTRLKVDVFPTEAEYFTFA